MTPQRPNSSHDLTRTALAVLFIGALLSPRSESCFRFIRPLMGRYDCHHDLAAVSQTSDQIVGKAGMATTVMTVALLLVRMVPLAILVGALIGNMAESSHR